MDLDKRKRMLKLIACIMIPLLFAFIVEGLSWFSLAMNRDVTQRSIDLGEIQAINFELRQGELVTEDEEAVVLLDFEESVYIHKLYLSYTSYGPLRFALTTVEDRGHGETATRTFSMNANMLQEFTAISLQKEVYQVAIHFHLEENEDIAINEIVINNEFHGSPWRFFFAYASLFLLLLIVLLGSEFVGKEQRFFVIAGFLMGIIAITSMPPHTSGWDEEIHFQRSYSLSYTMRFQREYQASPTVVMMTKVLTESWPFHYPNTMEDRRHLVERYNELDIATEWWDDPDIDYGRRTGLGFGNFASFILLAPGYVTQAAFVAVGRILQLPFSVIYMMGRIGNLLLYLGVGYFAIKRSIVGRKVMTALLLMPTPLFLATVYSYDATVNAFIALGIACILREIYGKEEKVSYFNLGLFVVSIVLASMP